MAEQKNKERQTPQIPDGAELLGKIKAFWSRQPAVLKVSLVTIAILTIAAGAMLMTADFTDMRTLYSNLTPEDAAAITEFIKGKKVRYQLEDDGGTITVPADQVHQLRMDLASEGLPKGGGVGFELFDHQQFGMTEFEERVAMRRALEGELSRTITRLNVVKSAKANLVLPKKSLLGSKSTPAQASVVLELYRGRALPEGTIESIVHLVSSSVEGLSPDNVTLVDTNGKLLSAKSDIGAPGGEGMKFQRKYETQLENRIEQMLDRLLGPGKSITRVAAQFDFSRSEIQEEHYDPEKTAVRSERRETEISGTSSNGAEGIPGSRSNLPGGEAPRSNSAQTNSKKEMETKNWEIDKVIKKTVAPGSELKRITVSVMVDGANKPGDKFVPRSKDELKKIERAVQGTIGYSEERGDRITVQSISFHQPPALDEETLKKPFPWKEYLPLAIGALVILFAFLVLLTFRRKKTPEKMVQHNSGATLLRVPRSINELESMLDEQGALPEGALPGNNQLPGSTTTGDAASQSPDMSVFNLPPGFEEYALKTNELQQEVKEIFAEDSETAARIISTWINQRKNEPEDSVKENAS